MLKGLRFLHNFFKFKIKQKTPLKVFNAVTFRCNLKCKYCGLWRIRRMEMTTKQIEQAMKEFAKAGTLGWAFTGGEPLLRKDIDKLTSIAKDLGFILTLNTNGILLYKKLNKLRDVDLFLISLDGIQKVNDTLRGKNVFKKILNTIPMLKDLGINFAFTCVLSKKNLQNDCKELKKFLTFIKRHECRFIPIPLYLDHYNKCLVKTLIPTNKELIKSLEIIRKFKKKNPKNVLLSYQSINKLEKLNIKWKCFAGKAFCYLFPDGLVAPCFFKEKLGNDGLSNGFVKAFNNLPTIKYCRCLATCYIEHNSLFTLHPLALLDILKIVKVVLL